MPSLEQKILHVDNDDDENDENTNATSIATIRERPSVRMRIGLVDFSLMAN